MRIPVLDFYIIQEYSFVSTFGLLLVVAVWLCGNDFNTTLALITQLGVTLPQFMTMIGLILPRVVAPHLAIAALLASFLALRQMRDAGEILAMRLNGASDMRIIVAPVIFGICLTLVGFWLNEAVVPESIKLFRQQLCLAAYRSKTTPRGNMHKVINSSNHTHRIFFLKRDGQGRLTGSIVLDVSRPREFYFAQGDVTQVSERDLQLQNGTIIRLDRKSGFIHTSHFKKASLPWGVNIENAVNKIQTSAQLKLSSLLKLAQTARNVDTRITYLIHHKIASPLLILCFALLPLPFLLRRQARITSNSDFAYLGLIVIGFHIIDPALTSLGEAGSSQPVLIAWLPNFIVAGLIAMLAISGVQLKSPLKL